MRRSTRISTAKAAAAAQALPLAQEPTLPDQEVLPSASSAEAAPSATPIVLPLSLPPPVVAPIALSSFPLASTSSLSAAAAVFVPGQPYVPALPNSATLVNLSPSRALVEAQPSPPPSPKTKYVLPKRKDHAWKDLALGKGAGIKSLNMDVFDR